MGGLGVDDRALTRLLVQVHAEFPLERAILVGSRARGEELTTSDHDLILVSEAFAGLAWWERIRRVSEHWTGAGSLDPLCYTPAEFQERATGLTSVRDAVEAGRDLPVPS